MPRRRRTNTRRNPAPRYSRVKLEALRNILNRLIAYYASNPSTEATFHEMLLEAASHTVLGGHHGLNADFVNEVLHLGSGRPLREAYEPYLFFGDQDDEPYEIVMHVPYDEGDPEEGSLRVEDIAVLKDPVALVQWVEKTLSTV